MEKELGEETFDDTLSEKTTTTTTTVKAVLKPESETNIKKELSEDESKEPSKDIIKDLSEAVCEVCKAQFSTKTNKQKLAFKDHKINCHNICLDKERVKKEAGFAPGLFPCELCDHVSSSATSLGIHTRKNHTEKVNTNIKDLIKNKKKVLQMFSCEFCEKSYPLQRQLEMHKKKIHTMPKQNLQKVPDVTNENEFRAPKEVSKETNLVDETKQIQAMLMAQISDNEISEDDDEGDIKVLDMIAKPKTKSDVFEQDDCLLKLDKPQPQQKVDTHLKTRESNTAPNKTEMTKPDESEITEEAPADLLLNQLKTSKYFQGQPWKIFSQCTEPQLETFSTRLDFLPGWRSKKDLIRRRSGETFPITVFLSPEKILIKSGLGVVEYLRLQGVEPARLVGVAETLKIRDRNLNSYIGRIMFDF